MKNSPFSDIKKKGKKPDLDEFIDDAKVDGTPNQLDKNERRGSSYIDKETGEKVKLTGKILQVPVNGYELNILEEGAKKVGLPLGSYLRTLGLEAAEK
ncbi:hypothetical protein [Vibrio aestuarianus]|uniref:hypothetical protein n=1 Tax=Vibrio aestuarianus TaxID=28171 RepID=UPI00237CB5A0|nr:hypothetical protein [Vibrio aestuarianus]MDE1240531.1 hypothetical protein [Vibrio aestuarianus]